MSKSGEFDKYADSTKFSLRFYVSKFAGYGLHEKCMVNLNEFRKLCKV